MKELHTLESIRSTILKLEQLQAHEYALVQESLLEVSERIKPLNLIKSTLENAIDSNEIRGGAVSTLVSLTAGYFIRKFFIGTSNSPVKKLLGTAIMFGASKILSYTGLINKMENGIWNLVHSIPEETAVTNEAAKLNPEESPDCSSNT